MNVVQVKIAAPKMVIFLKAVTAYFILDAHNQQNQLWSTFLKCAPICGLIIFIMLMRGINSTNK